MRLQLTVALVVLAVPTTALADSPWRLATDTLVYTDDDNVDVVSPQLAVHRELDERGGEVGVRVAVDYISAASVDVVSQASTRFTEVRSEVDVSASLYVLDMLPSVGVRYSHEPDYQSRGARVGVERRVGSADTTVTGGYGLTLDSVGMSGTPAAAFSERLATHSGSAGITQVLGRNTLVRAVYSLTVQHGYMEKPYRLVPLFDEAGVAAAAAEGVELGLATFDRYRLYGKPPEEVPDDRVRHAFAVRLMRYVSPLSASAALDYQLYVDSWGIAAHTAEPAIYTQASETVRLRLFGRFYRQSAASFWRRVYVVTGEGAVPRWRTVDRRLSPFTTLTGGARVEWTPGRWTAYLEGSAMWTTFDDYLLLDERLAISGRIGARWTP